MLTTMLTTMVMHGRERGGMVVAALVVVVLLLMMKIIIVSIATLGVLAYLQTAVRPRRTASASRPCQGLSEIIFTQNSFM